ncbi:MAG: hypothetical protein KDI36_14500 [Pseudomonadales bacterium]|nr:hypothetical protein [Pseudomonadales bacterium]
MMIKSREQSKASPVAPSDVQMSSQQETTTDEDDGHDISCPGCHSSDRERVHRKAWMKLFVGSKRYRCLRCYREYLVFRPFS